MNRRRAVRMPAVRVAGVLLLLLTLLVGGASAAQAVPNHDGPGCTDILDAESPVAGMTGVLVPPPATITDVDPFGPQAKTTTLWQHNGYGGLVWHMYDLGCTGQVGHPQEAAANWFANASLSVAKDQAAFYTAPMMWVDHRSWMDALDPVISDVATAMRTHFLLLLGPLVLALIGLLILSGSHRQGATSQTMMALSWALLVLFITVGISNYPVQASRQYDKIVTGAMDAAGSALGYSNTSAATAISGAMTDQVLYPSWLQGEFGSSTSSTAQAFGPALYQAQTYSRAQWAKLDAAQHADIDQFGAAHANVCPGLQAGVRRACLLEAMSPADLPTYTALQQQLFDAKDKQFNDAAAKVKALDPAAYEYVAGHSSGSAGTGAALSAIVQINLIGPFPFVAGLLVAFSLIVAKFVVMLLPALGVIFMFYGLRGMALGVAKRVLMAVVAAPVFTALTMVDITWVTHTMRANVPLPARLLFAAAGAVFLWVISKPVRSLRALVTGTSSGHPLIGKLMTFASSFLGAKEGVEAGVKKGGPDQAAAEEPGGAPMEREENTRPALVPLSAPLRRPALGPAPVRAGTRAEEDIVDAEIVEDDPSHGGMSPRPRYEITSTPAAVVVRAEDAPPPLSSHLLEQPRSDDSPLETVNGGRVEDGQHAEPTWVADVSRTDAPNVSEPVTGEQLHDVDVPGSGVIYDPRTGSMTSLRDLDEAASVRREEGQR